LAKTHLKAVYNNSDHKVQVFTYCGPNSVDSCLLLNQEQEFFLQNRTSLFPMSFQPTYLNS